MCNVSTVPDMKVGWPDNSIAGKKIQSADHEICKCISDMKVVIVVEDSLPNRFVGKQHTPVLWNLITSHGGWSEQGGRSVLASNTYPNHATFVTGADVQDHRIFTNKIWNGQAFVCSSTVGPAVETIFDVANCSGLSTAAVLGDKTMVGVTAAQRAHMHWPPIAGLAERSATDTLGYSANSVVLEKLDELDALSCDLCFVHMNEPDSALHVYGPDAAESMAQIRRCDSDLALIVERLQSSWDDTVLFVLSDHEQETIDQSQDELYIEALLTANGLQGHGHDEGAVALIVDGADASAIMRLPEINGAVDLDAGVTLVWSGAGRVFGQGRKNRLGQHGSPRTTTQVATVSGGHPIVPKLSEAVRCCSPHGSQWAPTVATLFGLSLPQATGLSLI